jgi:hypothetical protein
MNRRGFFGRVASVFAGLAALPLVPKMFRPLPAPTKSELDLLVEATLKDLGKLKFADIATDLQRHMVKGSI